MIHVYPVNDWIEHDTDTKSSKVTEQEVADYGLNPKQVKFGRAWFFWLPRAYTNKGIPFKSIVFQLTMQWLFYDLTLWIRNEHN